MDWNQINRRLRSCGVPKILFFEEIGSTQEAAFELAIQGARQGTVVISESQYKGRGRLGRFWFSPKGGLYLSMVVRPKDLPDRWPLYSLVFGLTVCRVIGRYADNVGLKWPNDCLIDGKKVCGVLSEAYPDEGFLILGIGVNLKWEGPVPDELLKYATTLFDGFFTDPDDEERFVVDLLCALVQMLEDPTVDIEGLNEVLDRTHLLNFDGLWGRQKRVNPDGTLVLEGPAGRSMTLGEKYVTGHRHR